LIAVSKAPTISPDRTREKKTKTGVRDTLKEAKSYYRISRKGERGKTKFNINCTVRGF